MKVLVTGAAGFIGSHVANYLEAQGFDVIRSDIVSTPEFHGAWRQADLTKIEEVLGITSDIEAICHVGGIGDVYFAATEPRTTMNTNATGTLNMLEAARRAESIRFVYASTWEVYGPSKYEPVDEGHPCFPAHPYSISKLAGDLLVQAYGRNNSMESVVLRLGTAYGPRMRETAVIPAFILRAIRNEQIEVRGTGH